METSNTYKPHTMNKRLCPIKLENVMFYNRSHLIITIIFLVNVLVLFYGWKANRSARHFPHYDMNTIYDVPCYNSSSPVFPGISNLTSDKRIFFHELTCKGGLDSREACAIESAAKANPNWRIEVIFLGPVEKTFLKGEVFKMLSQISNVKFSGETLFEHCRDTPMEDQIKIDMTQMGLSKRYKRISDILRYITLYKYGGVYLDLDVIVVKSFDTLPKNWAAKQSSFELGAGAIGLSNDVFGRMVANATLLDILHRSNPLLWGNSNVRTLQRAMKKLCPDESIIELDSDRCHGFEVLDSMYFYPVSLKFVEDYRRSGILSLRDTYSAYAHHMWSEYDTDAKLPWNSRYSQLAKKFCPKVYALFEGGFGL